MKYIYPLFFFLLYFLDSNAQNCNCGSNFQYLVKKIEKNYVGFSDKVTPANKKRFQKFTDSLQKIADQSNPYKCLSISREWLAFFKDKHINFGMDFEKLNPDSVKSFFADEEKTPWTENNFKNYLDANKGKLDEIEGVWFSGIYKLGIVKDQANKSLFIGFILKADGYRWDAQQIKLKITKTNKGYSTSNFKGGDHSEQFPILTKQNDTLDFGIFGKWYKGMHKTVQGPAATQVDYSPKFKVANDTTSIFELPSFYSLDYIAQVDSLISANKPILTKTKHLIIDLRNNSGGSVLIYQKLIPYIYTNPILQEGGSVLATVENIRDGYSTEYPQMSDSIKSVFRKNLNRLKAHTGELYNLYPVDTIKLQTVLQNPARISFLVNKETGSAAELFLLEARQSTKVKLYGTNSAGVVDYTETVKATMPCPFYTLWYPACKSTRLPDFPLDNIGIKPDIEIPDTVQDWIEFVINYRKN
ncbi:S41 family peptidase [Pedobacter ghigonis]|uniref:S41 family peptidase n=1 Tax=Pedobacter ghigonis TaxID=2730403 RepID=UPI001589C284|nr:S41 family peptidase [Pedobacter ghigonis]